MTMATSAFAASALVTTDLNLRTGPGTRYARIAAMPGGSIVDVRGCIRGYSWCRVDWNGYDGWAASSYLARRSGGGSFDNYAASIGVPLIAGAVIGGVIGSGFDYDHDHYYYHHRRYDRHYDRYVIDRSLRPSLQRSQPITRWRSPRRSPSQRRRAPPVERPRASPAGDPRATAGPAAAERRPAC